MRITRKAKALGTALAVVVSAFVALAMPGTAQAEYRVSKTVGIRMLDVNVLRSDCRTYPVEWVVGSFNEAWGTTGDTWDWRLTLTLANPKHPEERASTIRLSGVNPKAGRTAFRLCGTKHSAGRFVATARVSATPRATSGCAPLDGDVLLPDVPAGQARACSTAVEVRRDRAQIRTLFKRPVRLTVREVCPLARPTDLSDRIPIVGRLQLQGDDGRWKPAANRFVALQAEDSFVLGDDYRRVNRTRTMSTGRFRMGAPQFNDGGTYRVVVASTGRHMGAIANVPSDPIPCAFTDVGGTPSGA